LASGRQEVPESIVPELLFSEARSWTPSGWILAALEACAVNGICFDQDATGLCACGVDLLWRRRFIFERFQSQSQGVHKSREMIRFCLDVGIDLTEWGCHVFLRIQIKS